MSKSNCVVILSGGLDSTTLLHHVTKEMGLTPAVITFNYGQKHTKEIESAIWQVQSLGLTDHQVIDLNNLRAIFASSSLVQGGADIPSIEDVLGDPQPSTYVPNRNMIFLALAVAYAETLGVSDVYYGAQLHDMYGYWDTTSDFLESLNQVYSLNRKAPISIKAPFVSWTKADIADWGYNHLGVDYSQTWSCYEGGETPCLTCPTCAERLNAFDVIGVADPCAA